MKKILCGVPALLVLGLVVTGVFWGMRPTYTQVDVGQTLMDMRDGYGAEYLTDGIVILERDDAYMFITKRDEVVQFTVSGMVPFDNYPLDIGDFVAVLTAGKQVYLINGEYGYTRNDGTPGHVMGTIGFNERSEGSYMQAVTALRRPRL